MGQTVDYNINIFSLLDIDTGNPPFGFDGPPHVRAEMHYADIGPTGVVEDEGPMPGQYAYDWDGIISYGYQTLSHIQYPITDPSTQPGLDDTTVAITATAFFGSLDIVFFDGIAGIWDPQ